MKYEAYLTANMHPVNHAIMPPTSNMTPKCRTSREIHVPRHHTFTGPTAARYWVGTAVEVARAAQTLMAVINIQLPQLLYCRHRR